MTARFSGAATDSGLSVDRMGTRAIYAGHRRSKQTVGDGFFPPKDEVYDLRCPALAPSGAVRECKPGSAFLILTRISPDTKRVRFASLNVPLDVVRDWECFFPDFLAHPRVEVASPSQPSGGLGEPDPAIETRASVRY